MLLLTVLKWTVGGGGHPAPPITLYLAKLCMLNNYNVQNTTDRECFVVFCCLMFHLTNFETISVFILHYTRREKLEGN